MLHLHCVSLALAAGVMQLLVTPAPCTINNLGGTQALTSTTKAIQESFTGLDLQIS